MTGVGTILYHIGYYNIISEFIMYFIIFFFFKQEFKQLTTYKQLLCQL